MEEWNGRKTEETSRCECLGFQDVANAVGRQEVVRLKLTARLKGVKAFWVFKSLRFFSERGLVGEDPRTFCSICLLLLQMRSQRPIIHVHNSDV